MEDKFEPFVLQFTYIYLFQHNLQNCSVKPIFFTVAWFIKAFFEGLKFFTKSLPWNLIIQEIEIEISVIFKVLLKKF